MNKLKNESSRPDYLYGTRLNGVFAISGLVHVIRDESELPYFREGEILVANCIDSSWVKQLSLAKALIEDATAVQSHVKTIANHFNIPAVAGVEDAVASLRSGDIITIYSDGQIELRTELRAPDSPMRVSVPDAVEARNHNGIITVPNVVSFKEHANSVKADNLKADKEPDTEIDGEEPNNSDQ